MTSDADGELNPSPARKRRRRRRETLIVLVMHAYIYGDKLKKTLVAERHDKARLNGFGAPEKYASVDHHTVMDLLAECRVVE